MVEREIINLIVFNWEQKALKKNFRSKNDRMIEGKTYYIKRLKIISTEETGKISDKYFSSLPLVTSYNNGIGHYLFILHVDC